jgi:hypothetical protein
MLAQLAEAALDGVALLGAFGVELRGPAAPASALGTVGLLVLLLRDHRLRLAREARDWPAATALQNAVIAWDRDQAAEALAGPPASLTAYQRTRIRYLAVDPSDLGNILLLQEDPGCVPHSQEALTLAQRLGDRVWEAQVAGSLGNAHVRVPGLRDLDQAEKSFQRSLRLRPDSDRLGRARNLGSLGRIALERFDDALAAGEAEPVLLEHLNSALRNYQQALDSFRPMTTKNEARSRASSVSSTAGWATPARPCATTSNPSTTNK